MDTHHPTRQIEKRLIATCYDGRFPLYSPVHHGIMGQERRCARWIEAHATRFTCVSSALSAVVAAAPTLGLLKMVNSS